MAAADPDLTIVVVVYNTGPHESSTIGSLADVHGVAAARLVIWDNGLHCQRAAFTAALGGRGLAADYVHTPENRPLSAIYNHVADAAPAGGFLLILDQDTRLPADYLLVFRAARHAAPGCRLFAPTIRAGDRLASPASFRAGWGRSWPAPRVGLHPSRGTTVINSGLFIDVALFHQRRARYDERLRLYGTDTGFFLAYARVEPDFYILPVVLDHDLSFDLATTAQKAAKLDQMLAANREIYRSSGPATRALVGLVGAVVRLRHALRHRSIAFLFRRR